MKAFSRGRFVVRELNGRASRSDPYAVKACSPAEVRRLRDAALAGMADERWGTELGRLFLSGKISAPLFEAGKRWRDAAQEYHEAILAPAQNPKAHSFERRGHSHPLDPGTAAGMVEAADHRVTVDEFLKWHAELSDAGSAVERETRAVCERDEAPVGESGLNALDIGLRRLSGLMGLTNPDKNVR